MLRSMARRASATASKSEEEEAEALGGAEVPAFDPPPLDAVALGGAAAAEEEEEDGLTKGCSALEISLSLTEWWRCSLRSRSSSRRRW